MRPQSRVRAAFTLIEIMIVVAIMGLTLTMGVPIVWRIWHKQAMAQAVRDVVEVCSNARAQAILRGATAEVVFHPKDGRMDVSSASGHSKPSEEGGAEPAPAASFSGHSAQLDMSHLRIEMLDINLRECMDQETAHVRFFPNGTCDELRLILLDDRNQRLEISLEITTGLTCVESDPQKFR
jgi:prepilin-type N-terminal cleavage/methylation domain-containing protein